MRIHLININPCGLVFCLVCRYARLARNTMNRPQRQDQFPKAVFACLAKELVTLVALVVGEQRSVPNKVRDRMCLSPKGYGRSSFSTVPTFPLIPTTEISL